MKKLKYKKKDIICKLMDQIYLQIDEIKYLKETNELFIKKQWPKEQNEG